MSWELEEIETSYVAQLRGLGWTHVEDGLDHSAVTGRVRVTPMLEGGAP
jgi:type I restriction enzyme R subunit